MGPVLPIDLYLRQEMTNARFALPIFGIFLLCVITAAIPMDNDDLEDTKLNPNVDPAVAVLEQAHVRERVPLCQGRMAGVQTQEKRKDVRSCFRQEMLQEGRCGWTFSCASQWKGQGEGLRQSLLGLQLHQRVL